MNGMNGDCPTFYGKYRGVVTDNKDPNGLGRVRAKVQDVLGDKELGWAMPSVPYAGKGVGLYLIPPEKTSVWIEFEHGDPDYPIWCGCFWAPGEVPVKSAKNETMPEKKVLKTDVGTITLNDSSSDGAITIETAAGEQGPRIVVTTTGLKLSCGPLTSIELSFTDVKINGEALVVKSVV